MTKTPIFNLTITTLIVSLITMINPNLTCNQTLPLITFLETIQQTAFQTYGLNNFDPKLYVDMSLKQNLSLVTQFFDQLPRNENGFVSVSVLNEFLEKYLSGPDEDLVYVKPVDFVEKPDGFLVKVENEVVRSWALEIHGLWKNLSRKVSARVFEKPEFFTLLQLENPVMIPGERFREVYYWDSYWVISQPPLLSSMVIDIYNRTSDKNFIVKALPALLKEHDFWTSGVHEVIIQDAKGSKHSLSRYYAKWDQPRPESATLDRETASSLSSNCSKAQLYREIASAAESGWDFSTRWMRNGSDLTTLAATKILPVDLNTFILKMELDITSLAQVTGDASTAARFKEASQARKLAIDTILWNEEMQQWLDYWLSDSNSSKVHKWEASGQNRKIFASNFVPLWIQPFNSELNLVDKVVKSLKKSGLVCPAGIATSLTNSGQQWDFPNGWAPLQHMIADGLMKSGSELASSLAEEVVVKWIRTNYVSYKETGNMHEKYDVEKCGGFGGGGEYVPQTGFGWSNGVVLAFLEEFGWTKDLKPDCPEGKILVQ